MTIMTQTRAGMPMDEFLERSADAPFELIDGVEYPIMPNAADHIDIIRLFYSALMRFNDVDERFIIYTEGTFVLSDVPKWVSGSRLPDISIYEAERMKAYRQADPDWRLKPFVLIPDVCIEIISPNDKYKFVSKKIAAYLADGVRVVVVVDSDSRLTLLHRKDDVTRLTEQDNLTFEDVMPGFSLPLARLFED